MDQKAPFSELKSNFCARESTSITVMFQRAQNDVKIAKKSILVAMRGASARTYV